MQWSSIAIAHLCLFHYPYPLFERLEGVNAAAADNNADGNVDISDVVQSLRQIVGLSEAPLAKVVSTSGQHSFTFDETVIALTAIAPGDADLSWIPTDFI